MPALSDLKSENLVTRAVEALRHILDELLVPGAELPSQGKLAERLGVSRTVIREAMRILESQGLLEITQGKLPRVLPPNTQVVIDGLSTLMERSSATLLDVLEVRRPVEIEVAVLAAERATGEHLRQMSEANEARQRLKRSKHRFSQTCDFTKLWLRRREIRCSRSYSMFWRSFSSSRAARRCSRAEQRWRYGITGSC